MERMGLLAPENLPWSQFSQPYGSLLSSPSYPSWVDSLWGARARSTKQGLLHPVAKGLIYIGIAVNDLIFLAGLVFLIMALTGGGILGIFVAGAMMLISGVIIWILVSWLRTVPEFMRRLEHKLLK